MKFILSFSLLTILSIPLFSQTTLSGQIRPRFELRNGFKKPTLNGEEPAAFTEQRSRIALQHKANNFDFKISLQDVRVWGETGQINKSDGLFSLHEAYGQFELSKKSVLRIGRQEFVYDNERILGNLDWAAQARSHDAVKYIFQDSSWALHLAGTWNQDNDKPEPQNLQSASNGTTGNNYSSPSGANSFLIFALPQPKTTQFLWFHKDWEKTALSTLILNDGIQSGTNAIAWMQTGGFLLTKKIKTFELLAEAYYQGGQNTDSTFLNAWMASIQLSKTFKKKTTLTLGTDVLSGDDKSTASKYEGFDPLYGTHHKFYGHMDYFYVGNGHNGGSGSLSGGIIDCYTKLALKIKDRSTLNTDLHAFLSPTNIIATPGAVNLDTYYGLELDLVYSYKISEVASMKTGISQFINSPSLDAAKSSYDNTTGINSWFWVMINFTPKFI